MDNNIHSLRHSFYAKRIRDQLALIAKELELSSEKFQYFLGLNDEEYFKFKNEKLDVHIMQLERFSSMLNFGLSSFINNEIDFHALKKHYHGDDSYLPEKYRIGAFSRKINVASILNYLEKRYGHKLKQEILNYFQLNYSIFNDHNGTINVLLVNDIFKYILKRGLPSAEITQIAHYNIVTNKNTPFGKTMGELQTPARMYEFYLNVLINNIDQNNLYVITKMTQELCVLESREKDNVLDLFKVKHIGSHERCFYRVGALSAATAYLNMPHSEVTETKCVHRGDSVCEFKIKFCTQKKSTPNKEYIS